MAERFLPFADLREAVADRTFDRPPALVCNAHITGLGVARALAAHDVPVIALDRSGDGVAPPSAAVTCAGRVTYPLDDPAGFREDVEALAAETGHEPVAFGCMDEWVHALADAAPDGVRLPSAGRSVLDAVLDKEALYAAAEAFGVPYPETYRLSDVDPDAAADALGFPLVIKPARKREFEEAVGTNVIEVCDREALADVVATARDRGVRIMAQEKVAVAEGRDRSFASYVSPAGEAIGVVGNARVRYPRAYGTACVVDVVDAPELAARARSLLRETGYHGISEAEFVYDADREEYVLLDVNTRPWKWIGLPVTAGANLPLAAYASATGEEHDPGDLRPARWVSLRDYVARLTTDPDATDVLTRDQWLALLSGAFEGDDGLATAVHSPADPEPARHLLETEFTDREYYCAC